MNTTIECELFPTCGFFKKYEASKQKACRGFIAMYCRGEKMSECRRKEYRKKNGTSPSDDMMPSGHMLVEK